MQYRRPSVKADPALSFYPALHRTALLRMMEIPQPTVTLGCAFARRPGTLHVMERRAAMSI
jgi:hypothetical protein